MGQDPDAYQARQGLVARLVMDLAVNGGEKRQKHGACEPVHRLLQLRGIPAKGDRGEEDQQIAPGDHSRRLLPEIVDHTDARRPYPAAEAPRAAGDLFLPEKDGFCLPAIEGKFLRDNLSHKA